MTASQPSSNKTPDFSEKLVLNLFATFVENYFELKETFLNYHNRDVHTKVESPCSLCDKSFKSKKKLRYHMSSTHAEKEALNCDIKSDGIQCIYHSVTNSNLRAHKKRVHEKLIFFLQHISTMITFFGLKGAI